MDRVVTGLSQDQDIRRKEHPEAAEQIDKFIKKIEKLKEMSNSFTMVC